MQILDSTIDLTPYTNLRTRKFSIKSHILPHDNAEELSIIKRKIKLKLRILH